MLIDRRALLGAAAALSVPSLAATVAAPLTVRLLHPGKREYAAALEVIAAAAQASLATVGLPGMALALRGPDGFAAELCLGWADLTARTPVRADHLFEIGSISKSLVALTLWKLAAAGRIDLAAPVSRYLPGELLPPTPITTLQLLNHVAELPDFAPLAPPGGLWTGGTPGKSFYYSNTGYLLAGLLIDAVTGRPHAEVIREQVLAPLGTTDARARIRSADRPRFATGYGPVRLDAVPMYGSPLVEGPWTDEDMGAGSVAATVTDMGAYLSYVLALGAGRGAPVLADDAARTMLSPAQTVADPPGGYSNGFMRVKVDERPVLHHTGGMLLFTSAFHADPAAGTGAFASVNGRMGEYRPKAVTAYAIAALRAAAEGRALPPLPDPRAPRRLASPARYAGEWVAADGSRLVVATGDLGPTLTAGGRTGRLESFGGVLGTDLSGWETTRLEFEAGDAKAGRGDRPFDRLWVGDRLYGRGAAPPAPAATPDRLRVLAGDYQSADPWLGSMTLVARAGRLVLPGTGPLEEDARGFWRLPDDAGGRERLRFDSAIGGRPYRLWVSGVPHLRIA